jgi:hypothetical protein
MSLITLSDIRKVELLGAASNAPVAPRNAVAGASLRRQHRRGAAFADIESNAAMAIELQMLFRAKTVADAPL